MKMHVTLVVTLPSFKISISVDVFEIIDGRTYTQSIRISTDGWNMLICHSYLLIRSMGYIFIKELPASLTYPVGVLVQTNIYGAMQVSAKMYDYAAGF